MSEQQGAAISGASTLERNPLQQIAESSQHRLLLKQWMKEAALINRRIAAKETRLDSNRKESTHLCCFFFFYHAIILVLLYNVAAKTPVQACKRAWIPSLVSVISSAAIICGIWYKIGLERHEERLLDREKEDAALLSKCIEELKRSGLGFDLFKEVETLRRAKVLKTEESASGVKWSGRATVTLFLLCISGVVLGFIRLVLCS